MPLTAVDVSFFVNQTYSGVSGLTRYDRGLLKALAAYPDVQVKAIPLDTDPLPKWTVDLAARAGLGLGQFVQNYPIAWPKGAGNLVHLPQRGQASLLWNKGSRKVVVTVHDIIHYLHRSQPDMHVYRHAIQKWFDLFSVRMLKHADLVLASSEFTRQTLIEHAGLTPEQVQVIYLGVEQERFQPREIPPAFYQKYKLEPDKQYVLHISTEEARKNVPALIRAFALVHAEQRDVRLLKIGRPLYPQQRLANLRLTGELGLENEVIFIDNVPDDDLPMFYSAASVTALPSLMEGFGFPVLESMACGTPVVCSNTASLPELAGEAAWLVSPQDVSGIAQAILCLLGDPIAVSRLRNDGLAWVSKFTWENTAAKTIQAYKQVLGRNF